VKRAEGQRRLEEIGGDREESLRSYASLRRELEAAVAQARKDKSWQLEAAEAFAGLLLEAVRTALHPEISAPTRALLSQALTEGPEALASLETELAERLRQAQGPEELLRILRARRSCLELRMRCLDHLATIFDARRSQP
jgi:hypothetical protein